MPPGWPEVAARLTAALGEPVTGGQPMTPGWTSRMTWAARGPATGLLVVKVRGGESAAGKTRWCAEHLPLLAARGYPVPAIVWHGPLRDQWHLTVQTRLPGRPLTTLDEPLLEQLLALAGLQAGAGIPAGDRDFTSYVAHVLFDDWDDVWSDASRAGGEAPVLCARIRRWLAPVWGLRLPPADFAHNDFNLSNILADGAVITGVVDWDEFALGSRALDLVVLALDCQQRGLAAAADRLLDSADAAAGPGGLRCLASYRVLAGLAECVREDAPALARAEIRAAATVLDKLRA